MSASLADAGSDRLKITEIFLSLQGESDTVGFPTVFVRLTGCPLRCQYCDTAYAFHGGEWCNITAVIDRVRGFGVPYVCVTGGEPLAQKNSLRLLVALCDAGFKVSLETSGAISHSSVDARVQRVVDVKTPGSNEEHQNLYDELGSLRSTDLVKFVVCGRADYDWSRACIARYALAGRCTVLLSPSFGQVAPADLADWILADRLPVRFQLQLHKVLWGDVRGR